MPIKIPCHISCDNGWSFQTACTVDKKKGFNFASPKRRATLVHRPALISDKTCQGNEQFLFLSGIYYDTADITLAFEISGVNTSCVEGKLWHFFNTIVLHIQEGSHCLQEVCFRTPPWIQKSTGFGAHLKPPEAQGAK